MDESSSLEKFGLVVVLVWLDSFMSMVLWSRNVERSGSFESGFGFVGRLRSMASSSASLLW